MSRKECMSQKGFYVDFYSFYVKISELLQCVIVIITPLKSKVDIASTSCTCGFSRNDRNIVICPLCVKMDVQGFIVETPLQKKFN